MASPGRPVPGPRYPAGTVRRGPGGLAVTSHNTGPALHRGVRPVVTRELPAGTPAGAGAARVLRCLRARRSPGCGRGPAQCEPAGPRLQRCAQLIASSKVTPPPVDPASGHRLQPVQHVRHHPHPALIIGVVHAMVRNGMRAAGYRYVILDDGWQGRRASSGQLTADPRRFPCGMKRLADFLHATGSASASTPPRPQGVRRPDRQCRPRRCRRAHLRAVGRGLRQARLVQRGLLSGRRRRDHAAVAVRDLCHGQADDPLHQRRRHPVRRPVGAPVANSWRVGGDICGSWYNLTRPPAADRAPLLQPAVRRGDLRLPELAGPAAAAAMTGPGHFIDPDMLEVGTAPESSGVGRVPGRARAHLRRGEDQLRDVGHVVGAADRGQRPPRDGRSGSGQPDAAQPRQRSPSTRTRSGRAAGPDRARGAWQVWLKH